MKKAQFISFIILVLSIHFSFGQTKKWTLEECVDYAIKNNITIKQTELDLKNAEIDKKSAFGNFLPNVNGSGSHSWSIGSNTNPVTNVRENQTTQFSQIGLSSNVDIYNGLQNQNRFRKSKLAIVSSQYQLEKIKDDISLNIVNAFLQILFNKESIKVQQEQLANNEKQFARTTELVNAGVVPRGDLLDVKATVASDKQRLVAAENTLFISKLSLAQLLQLDDFEGFDISDENYTASESATMLQKPEDILAKATENRVELKIAKTNIEVAEKDITIAKGAFQPSLSAGYNFSTSASYSDRIVGVDADGVPVYGGPNSVFNQFSDNKGHNIGLQINVPIFNGFSTKNNVERSKIALERTKINQQQATLDLQRNVYNAITDAKGAKNSYQSAITALEARQEAFNYAKEKYAVGMMNSFDYNQAQTLLTTAQSEVLRTKYDYIFKIKLVEFYFGIPIKQKN
jgi:outer membrane protein